MIKHVELISAFAFAVGLVGATLSGAAERRWLEYRQEVTIQGRLLKQRHTEWLDMLPNPAEGRKRAKWAAYILRLDAPVSVRATDSEDASFLETEQNVREVFLSLLPEVSEKLVDSLVGKHVTVTGKLDHATTVHHLRLVMIDVSAIR